MVSESSSAGGGLGPDHEVVAKGGYQKLRELQDVLRRGGVESELLPAPGCDPNG